jgi:hypothetical protein
MNIRLFLTVFTVMIALSGCSGGNGAGHWFHILFVIVPLGFIFYFLNKKIDKLSESLFKIEGKISQLTSKLEKNDKKK